MKIKIMASGYIPVPQTYDLDDNAPVPTLGDTVIINGKVFKVDERMFDFSKDPHEVAVICNPKYT